MTDQPKAGVQVGVYRRDGESLRLVRKAMAHEAEPGVWRIDPPLDIKPGEYVASTRIRSGEGVMMTPDGVGVAPPATYAHKLVGVKPGCRWGLAEIRIPPTDAGALESDPAAACVTIRHT